MMEYYERITKFEIGAYLFHIYRVLAGISGLLVVVVIPMLIGFLYTNLYDTVHGTGDEFGYYSPWRDHIGEILTWLSISLFVAVAAVYFLRFLFWVRHVMQTSWKKHTPPFEVAPQNKEQPLNEPPESIIPEAEQKTLNWIGNGLLFYVGSIVLLILFVLLVEHLGVSSAVDSSLEGNLIPKELMEYLIQTITMLPFIGDLSAFLGMLPGDSPIQKFLVNGAALFFAVAVRNLSYIFENIGYLIDKAQLWRPNRYTGYLVVSGIGQVVLVFLGILIALGE